ncbi:PKD domain-containing protein [bacterium]|nr:PKD domain-containing protein [bacterium]
MRTLPLLAIFLLVSLSAIAQSPIWVDAWNVNSSGNGTPSDMCIDDSSNVYLVGSFSGTIKFGPYSLKSSNNDVYVVKASNAGKIRWARQLGGSGYDVSYRVAVDDSFNVYVTGSFSSNYGDGKDTVSSVGSYDGFLTKLNADGKTQWSVIASGSSIQYGKAVAVDGEGKIYWLGEYTGNSTIAGKSVSGIGSTDLFLAKLNRDGKAIKVSAYGGNSLESAVDISINGKIFYITGNFVSSNLKFGSTTLSSSGSYDVFLARFDTTMKVAWAIKGGGSSNDMVYSLHTGRDGSAYLAGTYISSFGMGGRSVTGSWYDVFALRVAANSKASYMVNIQHTSGFTQDILPTGIHGFKDGSVYVSGYFQNSIKIGSKSYSAKGSNDVFVLAFNKNGALDWINLGGNSNSETMANMDVDSVGYYYVAGDYFSSTKFGSNSLSGSTPTFVAKGTPPVTPPKFKGLKNRYVYYDSTFSRSFEVKPKTDATYKLLTAPNGMTIDPNTAVITFTPNSSQLGSYKVVIYVENLGGNDKDSFTMQVIKPLDASLKLPDEACVNQGVLFSQSDPSVGPLQVVWDFGDGATSTTEKPIRAYNKPGTFVVKMLATNVFGVKDSTTDTIMVNPIPGAAIQQISACLKDSIYLQNASTISSGSLVSYKWYRDQTLVSSKKDLKYFAATLDTNTYKLVSVSDKGCRDSTSMVVHITNKPTSKYSVYNACSGDETLFFDKSSSSDDTIKTYSWKFGDGVEKVVVYPGITHVYKTGGSFDAVLTVTTNNGCSASYKQKLTINPKPTALFDAGDFCFGQTMNLVDKSTTTAGTIDQRRWTTGDGKSYTKETVSHNYKTPGKYSITLIIANSVGCTDTLVKKITVAAKAHAVLVNTSPCEGGKIYLQDSSTRGANDEWYDNKWYRDGKYFATGNYIVTQIDTANATFKLVVSTLSGCKDSMETTVSPKPHVAAKFSLPNGCEMDTLPITENFDRNNLDHVKWFGLGVEVVEKDSHWFAIYQPAKEHQLFVRTFANNGCEDSTLNTRFTVYHNPTSQFNIAVDSATSTYSFVADEKGAKQYLWDLDNGAGSTSAGDSIAEKYTWNRNYHIMLTVMSDSGCTSFTDSLVQVNLPNSVEETNNRFTLYPNPASTWLKIGGNSQAENLQWKIYNNLGAMVLTGKHPIINVTNLNTGTYIIEIKSKDESIKMSFIKN